MTTFETFVETEAVVPLSRLRNTHVVFKIRWNHEFFVLVSVQICTDTRTFFIGGEAKNGNLKEEPL